MLRKLIVTDNAVANAILRIVLGVVFFAHGSQKMLGWFGGSGFTRTMATFTGPMHIPTVFALLAIIAEFFGAIGLILGFLTRVAAFGIAMIMLVAVTTMNYQYGFFANWSGRQKGEGIEYHLLALAICTFLMLKGAGAFSVDWGLSRRTLSIARDVSAPPVSIH